MKTDRELLEKAAKAVGVRLIGFVNEMIVQPDHRAGGFIIRNERGGDSSWHPLTDDGDALSLAVKLYLVVAVMKATHDKPAFTAVYHFNGPEHLSEPHGDDANAATRRAIVRVAAAIGETL